jgi:hypothetical protein
MNLSETCKLVRHSGAVAAGSTVITPSAGIDARGFESVLFVAAFGAIVSGAATSIEVHQSSDDGVADAYSALAGSKVTVADDADGKLAFVEIVQPVKRYLKLIVNRATQNATLDGIIAILSGPKTIPTVHDAATVAGGKTLASPAEGVA